ncbi:MAG: hypothetical protein U0414_26305 [Polyangiaceae bacterium]
MKRTLVLATCAALGGFALTRPAEAQENQRTRVINYPLVVSGAFTFGLPYVISVMSASTSVEPADSFLYIPVAGPWIDLGAARCVEKSCTSETLAKIGLVTDGVFQDLGALMIVGGVVFRREVVVRTSSVEIAPVAGAAFQGVRVSGAF